MQLISRLLRQGFNAFISVGLILSVVFTAAIPAYALCPPGQQEVSIGIDNPGGNPNCIDKDQTDVSKNSLFLLLKTLLQVASVGVGIVVAIGVAVGGIFITTARGNANQVQKGIETIRNAIIGLLLYIFMFAFLEFLIPGGILS